MKNVGNRCCGCMACVSVCPFHAIRIAPGPLGFSYPSVDSALCKKCGKCERVCPILGKKAVDEALACFWAVSKDRKTLELSSSGGVFSTLAAYVISLGGVVYGAVFSDSFEMVLHKKAVSLDDLQKMMGSKYVQSQLSPALYEDIAEELRLGKMVLFSGTPCQIVGVKSYLKERAIKELPLFVEVVCHGVPSPALWKEYLRSISLTVASDIESVSFRKKNKFIADYSFEVTFSDGSVFNRPKSEDWYMNAFLDNASLRESCFGCSSKRQSGSDLVLGDFWGIESFHPEAPSDNGVSAIIVNSKRGLDFLNSISEELLIGESCYEAIVTGNPCVAASSAPYLKRGSFVEDYETSEDFAGFMKRWCFKESLMDKIKRRLTALRK